jgi:hypothetical protein
VVVLLVGAACSSLAQPPSSKGIALGDAGGETGADAGGSEEGEGVGAMNDAMNEDVGTPGSLTIQIYVATTGNDSNPGTTALPLKTITAAQAKVRAHPERGTVPITVNVAAGMYYVGQTIVFTSADSGTQAAPVTYRGAGTATLSGGVPLTNLTWTPYKNGIMQAKVPANTVANLSFDNGQAAPGLTGTFGFSSVLLLNGQRQHMARYPNYTGNGVYGGNAGDAQTRSGTWTHVPTSSQPAYLHGVHAQQWGSEDYVLTGAGSNNQHGPFCNGRPQGINGVQMVENAFDELDAPNEWYFDRTGCCGAVGTLYFYPPTGVDLTAAGSYTLEMAGIERIFEFDGGCGAGAQRQVDDDGGVGMPSYSATSACASTPPVQWVTLDGFHYVDTLRTFPSCNEQILRSDWDIYRGGSIVVTGGENITISNSYFDQLGGAGVFVDGYDSNVSVTGNLFIDTGSSAILFMGRSTAVRDALFGYGTTSVPVNQLDMTPGPRTNDYPSYCSATDNLIHNIGDPELQVAGVGIDMAQDITVSHNSIYNTPRAGINVGDGCWGGEVISYNDVFATVLYTGDHGAFNSWGRDRYWDYSTSAIESRVGTDATGLPLLDVVKPNTLASNRWRCDNGWDVDLDDGSTHYVITNNIFLSGGLKWREGYDRLANNNVFVKQDSVACGSGSTSGCMSVHVWPTNSNDVFTHNIFYGYAPISPDAYGKELDDNLFHDPSELAQAQKAVSQGGYGTDMHSAAGDAMLVDAASGNFQLGTTSPATALGIASLPADMYGVTSPALRAQAATPPFGNTGLSAVGTDAGARDCSTMISWLGATVENLCGLNERTVVGLGYDVGVYVPTVPVGSQAANDGFKANDVIQQLGGQSVASLDDLTRIYNAATTGQMLAVGVWRNQRAATLTIAR